MSDELSTRDKILDGALAGAELYGLAKLSVSDICRQAGLSRQTLYKHFSSKEAVVAEAVTREAMAMMGEIVAAADAHDDPAQAFEAAILATLRLTREHRLLDRLIRTEPEALLPLLVSEAGPVSMVARVVAEQVVAQKIPALPAVELRRTADVLSRVLISYAVSAPDDPPEVVASFLATLITHGILDSADRR